MNGPVNFAKPAASLNENGLRLQTDKALMALIVQVSGGSTERAVYTLRDALGVKHVTYRGYRRQANAHISPFAVTTYDAAWVKRYLACGYEMVDPFLREGLARADPFRWDDIDIDDGPEAELIADAQAHDVGMSGLCIPVRGRDNRRALVSITSDLAGEAWFDFCGMNQSLLVSLAGTIHQIAVDECGGYGDEDPLSPREIETLGWTSKGKTVAEIAAILDLTSNTVAAYLRSARHKLKAANVAQAVSLAIHSGLIMRADHIRGAR